MEKILVIGATGFVGGHLAQALHSEGYTIRCLTRNPTRAHDLAAAGFEIVQGDISDPAAMQRALEGVQAAYISVHTLLPQQTPTARQSFMEVEAQGLENIVAGCKAHGVRRLVYVTSLGISPDALSAWLRGRWQAEQFLLHSGLDVTVIRPGQVIGVGGGGFDATVRRAKSPIAIVLGNGKTRARNIAIDDLVYYLVGVLEDPRAYGQSYNVGCDDLLTEAQTLDIVAETLGRRHPLKIRLPLWFLGLFAPLVGRAGKLPRGAAKAVVDALEVDMVGDPMPIRALLPQSPMSYRQAVERALSADSPIR